MITNQHIVGEGFSVNPRIEKLENLKVRVEADLQTSEQRDTVLLSLSEYLDEIILILRTAEEEFLVVSKPQDSQKPHPESELAPKERDSGILNFVTAKSVGESEPSGLDVHAPGAKLDRGKPRSGLIIGYFHRALAKVVDVGTFGAVKYTPYGWLKVSNAEERYKDALYRHLLAHEREYLDRDSGLPHLAHAAWCVLAWFEMDLKRHEEALADLKSGPWKKQGRAWDAVREAVNEENA